MTAALVLAVFFAVPCLSLAAAHRISTGYHRRCHTPQQPSSPPPPRAGRPPIAAGVPLPERGILAAHHGRTV